MSPQVNQVNKGNEIFWEYKGKTYPDICRRGNACVHIEETASKYCHGVGLDIGAGSYPYRDSFPVRNLTEFTYSNGKQIKRPSPLPTKTDANNLSCFVDNSLDYIFSSHCLEHLDKPIEALTEWVKKIKPNGIIFLYLPHPDMELWRSGSPWVKRAHKWIPTYEFLSRKFHECGLETIAGIKKHDSFYSFYIVGRKR